MRRIILRDSQGETLMLDNVWPVGSIYMSVNSTNPGTLFGGTWQRLKDRFLLGAGDTYAAGSQGGEATHTLTIDEMPAHSHVYDRTGGGKFFDVVTSSKYWTNSVSSNTSSVGGVQRTTTFRRISRFTCGSGLRNTGKVVQLNGRQKGSAARQRREQIVSENLTRSDLSGWKHLYVCQFNEPRYVIWRNMGKNQGPLFIGCWRYLRGRGNRRRSVCKTGFRKLYVIRMERWPYNAFYRCKRGLQWRLRTWRTDQIYRQHQHAAQQHAAVFSGLHVAEDGIASERRCA